MARGWIVIGVLAGALGLAPAAGAATVTHTEWWDKYGPKGTITVTAEPGERNDIVVHGTRITDTVPLHAGAGCEPDPDGGVRCKSGYEIVVQAGDLDDRVRFEPGGGKNDVYGGEGDDILVSSEFGARFDGGPGNDRMVGGLGGYDFFLEGTTPNGSDVIEGDRFSTVDYRKRGRPVRVDLDDDADDGERGERDRIDPLIGTVLGGQGADTLLGNDLPNRLLGHRGADLIRGRGGDDLLAGGGHIRARAGFPERIHGGPGDDQLSSGGGDDILNGAGGNDLLESGVGRDLLIPGPGADRANAGPSNDRIRARDRDVDEIDCGRGWDRLRNDLLDWQSQPRCERHDRMKPLG